MRAVAAYCVTLARLALHNPGYFFTFVDKVNAQSQGSVLVPLCSLFIAKIENVAELTRRKVLVRAALAVLPSVADDAAMSSLLAQALVAASGVVLDEEGEPGPAYPVRPNAILTDDVELYASDARDAPESVREWRQLHLRDAMTQYVSMYPLSKAHACREHLRPVVEHALAEIHASRSEALLNALREVPPEIRTSLCITL